MKKLRSMLGTVSMQTSSGGFSPASIPDLAAWYIAGVGQTGGSTLSGWADQSGNGRDYSQATAGFRPAIQPDGSVLFDGSDDFITASYALPQPLSIITVMSQPTWVMGRVILGADASAVYAQQNIVTPEIFLYAGAVDIQVNPNLAVATRGVFSIVLDNGANYTKINQTAQVDSASGASGITAIVSLGAVPDGTLPSNIQVWEQVIVGRALSSAELLQLTVYFQTKYGIA